MASLNETLAQFVTIFETMNIPYVVMGGIAVRLYAIPRPTYDVDFTISIEREGLPAFYDAVDAAGCTIPEVYRDGWIDEVAGMPLVKTRLYLDEGRGIDVDIFLAESEFQRNVLARRRQDMLDDSPVYFVTAEDLILLKLIAHRPRDIADVTDVLFTQGQLDIQYMQTWAEELQVAERLDDLLREMDELE